MTPRERFLQGRRHVPWSPWNVPRSLHGGWWSARDHAIAALMTDDGAGLISSWKDRINGLEMTASTTARPTYSDTGFAGAYPGVVGNGTANVMNRESTAGLPTGTTPGFIAIVGGGFSAGDTIVSYGGGGSTVVRQIETTTGAVLRGRVPSGVVVGTPYSADIPVIALMIVEANRLRMRFNGSETAETITLGTTNAVRARLFASALNTPNGFTEGALAEALIAPAWPGHDYLRLEGWAAAQYGITLADGHPYRSAAP